MKDIDKYRKCIFVDTVGYMLKYAVEFIDDKHIFRKFGKNGMTEYELNCNGKIEI